ncbi:hypothetical protein B0T18DRAFT_426922 [Schizothecium vesticola]|uniref:Secreted protein n=1 Tax=Schizothecium vesticola TaxID=314040 RepID=A0AA40F826_9PEZI|nr:hypothetical protein B0T18DRAFT_426922 [Schizothecium vesticola]
MGFNMSALVLLSLTFSSLGEARRCTNGLYYCGATLEGVGNYRAEMIAENQRVGAPTDLPSLYHTLYLCGVGGDGWIQFSKFCGYPKCRDSGWGVSDKCVA